MRYLLLSLSLLLISCFNEPLYHSQSYVFGTLVDISIYGETDEHARLLANHILEDFQNLHNQLHAWKPVSENKLGELGQINAAFQEGKKPTAISPELAAILVDATKLSIKSNGLFNPAIGYLISTWGFQRDEFTPIEVDNAAIKNLVHAQPRMTDIVINGNTVYSTNPTVKLDLGGYAKGYALDIAANYLHKEHVNNALINIGGNIIALGKHGENPWRVGIQHPRAPTAIATLELPDGWAIGTSGDYQRYFMLNGKRYCHIIDPRTGYPAQHTQSVTVLVPPQPPNQTQAGILSDVVSKPIFIETPANRNAAAQAFGIENFMVIDDQSTIFISSNMLKKIHWVESGVKFSTLP